MSMQDKMTVLELKRNVDKTGSLFFDKGAMKTFGDTIQNYGVHTSIIIVPSGEQKEVWTLWRKKPVKDECQDSAYFDKETFKRLDKKA